MGDRANGRPLNWPTVQLADPIESDWISVKIFLILLCNYSFASNQKLDVHQKYVCEQFSLLFLFKDAKIETILNQDQLHLLISMKT